MPTAAHFRQAPQRTNKPAATLGSRARSSTSLCQEPVLPKKLNQDAITTMVITPCGLFKNILVYEDENVLFGRVVYLGSSSAAHKPGVVVQAYNPST